METTKLENLIKQSLIELAKIANESDGKKLVKKQTSKLIFPIYSSGKKRVSEQEARFLFVRELENSENFKGYYSIETPTSDLYKFSDKDDREFEPKKGEGKSASFDLTIYDVYDKKFIRANFIEFKNENVYTIKKDFLKLLCDKYNTTNYLIHTIKSENSGTIPSIVCKYKEAINFIDKDKIISTLKIILFNIKDRHFIQFEINENKEVEEIKNEILNLEKNTPSA